MIAGKKRETIRVKSYHELSQELNEAVEKKSMPMCWYLSRPTSAEFVKMAKPKATAWNDVPDEIHDIWSWLGGRWADEGSLDSKKEIVKGIVKIASCKGRAAWTYGDGGIAYRGLGMSADRLTKYDMTGEVVKDGDNLYLVAKGKYKAKTAAQSWTAKKSTAFSFAHDPMGVAGLDAIPVVMVADIPKKDTFLTPKITNQIYAGHESEIIRVSNEPIDVTLWIKADDWFKGFGDAASLKDSKSVTEFLVWSTGKEAGTKLAKNATVMKAALAAGKNIQ